MEAYSRREGVPKPAADPEERRLEDAQGRAALELERVRRLERMGGATAADVQAARDGLGHAWAALELYRACSRYREEPTADRWRAAQGAALAHVRAHGQHPGQPVTQHRAAAELLEAHGLDSQADLAAIVEGWQ